jgi:hypothetical protein
MVPDQKHDLSSQHRERDGQLTEVLDSCPLAGPGGLAEACAGFGITSQEACFVLEAGVTGSVSLLAGNSVGDFEVVPWIGGLARFTD